MKEYLECPWCNQIYTKYGIPPHVWNSHIEKKFKIIGNKTNHWNKGLTKETDKRVKQNADNISNYYKIHQHPFKGKKQKEETLEKLRTDHYGNFFRCSMCKEFKHKNDFRKNSYRWNGLSYECRKCSIIKDRINYQKYRCVALKQKREYRNKHKEKYRERNRIHYQNNKEKYLEKRAKRKENFKWIKIMNNPFPEEIDIDWHHINNIFVVPIPRITHVYCYNSNSKKHRELCNKKLVDMNLIPIMVQIHIGVLV